MVNQRCQIAGFLAQQKLLWGSVMSRFDNSTKKRIFNRSFLVSMVSLATLSVASPGMAAQRTSILEEVVVTAQKRSICSLGNADNHNG